MKGEHPVERAFELARSGECDSLTLLGRRLRKEDYLGVSQHLSAPTLRKQLLRMMREAEPKGRDEAARAGVPA